MTRPLEGVSSRAIRSARHLKFRNKGAGSLQRPRRIVTKEHPLPPNKGRCNSLEPELDCDLLGGGGHGTLNPEPRANLSEEPPRPVLEGPNRRIPPESPQPRVDSCMALLRFRTLGFRLF